MIVDCVATIAVLYTLGFLFVDASRLSSHLICEKFYNKLLCPSFDVLCSVK